MVDTAVQLLGFLWGSFLVLSPMLLVGLLLAGLIHVLISRRAVLRWLSRDNLRSVCVSAAIGVPIPLCSCSVVPVVAEMRRKGASRSSCMSFLITAPETGADSIFVTHAFFGIVAAVVRPVVSFITAVVAGVFCIGLIREDTQPDKASIPDGHVHGAGEDECEHCDDHGHGHHEALLIGTDECYVSPAHFRRLVADWIRSWTRWSRRARAGSAEAPQAAAGHGFASEDLGEPSRCLPEAMQETAKTAEGEPLTLGRVAKHIFRYGFVEVADDILFALLVGIGLGALLYLAIPADLLANDYARWLSYPVMVVIGVPLYICASGSTPIAAALVAKGLSPGAALIFLMTGPATNSGTIAIIVSQFSARFASIYTVAVIVVTTVLGIAVDVVLIGLGLTLPVNLSASESPAIQFVEWAGAISLIVLIVWRFREGALKSGYRDFISNFALLRRGLRGT